MALALDASTPSATLISQNSSQAITGTFSPPAGSVIFVAVTVLAGSGDDTVSSISNSVSALTWNLLISQHAAISGNSDGYGDAEVWWANCPSAITGTAVTVNLVASTSGMSSACGIVQPLVFTGAATSQTGAASAGVTQSGANALPSLAVTTSAAGSWVWGAVCGSNSATALVAGTGQTVQSHVESSGDIQSQCVQKQNATTAGASTSVTMNDTTPSTMYQMVSWEVLAAASAAAAAPGPQVFVRPAQAAHRAAAW